MTENSLPIDDLRHDFATAIEHGPVVVTAPTGSGKSTQIPRWPGGRVVVIEPRRVACRSLAQRVAELESTQLGGAVGYQVRDEQRASAATRILFATPGIALRRFEEWVQTAETFILDEFHERGLETDLLLALLARHFKKRLVVMSATLDAARLTHFLGGEHLRGEGRLHPVTIRYQAGGVLLPDVRQLESRVQGAIREAGKHPGDILVFLPGKAEIRSCATALRQRSDLEVLELHGGLSLAEQSRVFQAAKKRKVILATNVAETSLTVPGIGIVIDSGLVRRTRYHRGRGFLTLAPIARDSAEQRAGRAGRTAAGVCLRLWSEAAQLEERTPPEIHRESLLPLVLAAANCGASAFELRFFDPPKEHALQSASQELSLLGALDGDGHLTERGRQLFGLPLDAPLGRWLIEGEANEAKQPGILDDLIDLVSALSVGRPIASGRQLKETLDQAPQNLADFCDAVALLQTLRQEKSPRNRRPSPALDEAQRIRKRLRQLFKRPEPAPDATEPIDRRRLALTLLAADPRGAHLARRRGRRLAWSHGGTEIELGRESRVRDLEEVEAIVVLETRAVGAATASKVLTTRAMPVPLDWLLAAGLGRDRLGIPRVEEGEVKASIETVYARRVLDHREEIPRGDMAIAAITELFLRGDIFPEALAATRDRLREATLAWRLLSHEADIWDLASVRELYPEGVPSLEPWARQRVRDLGVESGSDFQLLSANDFLAPELPHLLRSEIARRFPIQLTLPGATYDIEYDLEQRRATLILKSGGRKEPPAIFHLPRLEGFSIHMEYKGVLRTLRSRE